MKQKRIGIPGTVIEGPNRIFGVASNYLKFIERFGLAVILTPKDVLDLPEIDLLISPGGSDVLPTNYDAVPDYLTQKSNPILEHFDQEILPRYIENEVPVFGICRGMQQIWGRYGGHIDQNNDWHEQSSKYPQEQVHELYFKPEYFDYSKLIDKVTSRHHQCAVSSEPFGVPDELDVIAVAKQGKYHFDNIVEIFKHKELPIFGVQFHPEDHDYTDKLSSTIIKEFLGC